MVLNLPMNLKCYNISFKLISVFYLLKVQIEFNIKKNYIFTEY